MRQQNFGTLCKTSLRFAGLKGHKGIMNMKALTFFATAALAIAGTACGTESSDSSIVEASVETPPAAEDEAGEFNFSVGGVADEDTGSGFNFSLGESSDDDLLIGSEGIVDTDFGDTPEVGGILGDEIQLSPVETDPDAIIRVE